MGGRNLEDNTVLERILAGSEEPRDLSFTILDSITDRFSEERKIGEGGFGKVYKGVLQNGSQIAVKRIPVNTCTVDDNLFKRELKSLLKINHDNVVRFLGFCSSAHHVIERRGSEEIICQERERLLCFEYISNGSLDKHIKDELRGLEWNIRYQIIKGICEGLQYLHEEKGIKHMDLKPANILVDNHMVPKITDFGISRLDEKTHTTGERFVSRWYCAPEYENGGKISFKCDIYSLGVVIIELVTGCKDAPKKNNVLRRWKCRWNELVRHKSLRAQQVTKCIKIAESCMHEEPECRPSIGDVIRNLNENGNRNEHISMDGLNGLSSDDDMLWIKPVELRFAFEVNKETPCSVVLTNVTHNWIAFNIETLSQLQYCTEPKKGIVPSGSERTVQITLQAQEMVPQDIHDVDKFIVGSIKMEEVLEDEDITEQMFNNEAVKVVDKVDLTVVYTNTEVASIGLPLEETNILPVSEADIDSSSYEDDTPGQRTNRLIFHPSKIISAANVRYPRRENARAVDLMTGAMGILLPKLGELLNKEQHLQSSVKKDVESLVRQLKSMHVALCSLSEAQQEQLDSQDRLWANEVRDLSYDIEDVIDGFGDDFRGLIQKMFDLIRWGKTHHIAHAIQEIKVRVKEVADMRGGNKVCNFGANNPAATSTVDPRLLDLYKDRKELVGIDGIRDELGKRLTSGRDGHVSNQKVKVISIFGHGGLGKTTLAKVVYDKLGVKFEIKAFVSVGRNPDTKVVLKDILFELDNADNNRHETWDERKLIDKLRRVLKNKRYLIVIDDIWDIASWEVIKCAFEENDCGSRIITTSRNFEIAEKSGEVWELKPLSDYHSMKLFYARISGGEDTSSFDQLDEQTTKILQKCGGVPLAIITMASVLAGKPREYWPKVYSSIGFGNEANRVVDNTRKILLYSYYDLPCYLKTCLLYLSTYPEDHEIKKDTLVWKWIAEGFVHEEPGEVLFKVGEMYFNELVNRSMIQPVGGGTDFYTIYACRVHDMVLDMICSVARQESFVAILDSNGQHLCGESNARILAVQKRVVEQHDLAKISMYKQKLRSFRATNCRFSDMSFLPSFQALRVLSIEDCEPTGVHLNVKSLAGLLGLKYLELSGTPTCDLPMEIGDLRFLQTLDLRHARVEELPQSLIQLRQLKCLRSEDRARRLPDGMGNLTSLEDLRLHEVHDSPNFVKELGKLTELRVLCIGISDFDDNLDKALVESLSNLKKLEELNGLRCNTSGCYESNWDVFSPSRQLRHLNLHNVHHSHGLPVWLNSSLLPHLAMLNMSVRSALARDLEILGCFPELRLLSLFAYENNVFFPDAIAAGAFPRLLYYHMFSPLTYQPGAMPCLEIVQFNVVVRAFKAANVDFNFDSLQYLPLLQKVKATIDRSDVTTKEAEEAEAAVRRAVDIHPNRPILLLEYIGWNTTENLVRRTRLARTTRR